MSEYTYINYATEEMSAIITINREEVYNALNADAKLEIVKAIRAANRDENIRSIILTAAGKAFCTGQDLNDRNVQAGEKAVDLGNTLETEWNPLVMAIRDSKKIVIGAINGVCAGAGLSVALACDYIIASPGVKFISGFSKLGLAPDAGSSFTFTRALGEKRTLDFFLFNNPLLSEELASAGLINNVSTTLLESAKEVAQNINAMAPNCVELIKKNIQFAAERTFKESINNEIYAQRFLGNSQDYKEGLSAFFEKRAPNFKGN